MAGITEVQNLIEQQGRAFEEFKALHKAQMDEIQASGTAAAETTQAVAAANASIQAMQAQIRDLETMLNRPGGAPGGDNDAPPSVDAKAKKAEFFNFMRGRTPGEFRAALVEDATGEILVPEDLDTEIRRATERDAVMRTLARVRPTTSNRIRRRSMKLELGDALVESSLVPEQEFLYVEDLYGLTKIGEDELMDTDINLENEAETSFSRAVTTAEDFAFTMGTGHANKQPEGVFMPGNGITRVAAGQVNGITADDFIRLQYAVPSRYRNNGTYLMASNTELKLRLLKDNNGLHLWQPTVAAGRPATFNGRPVYNHDDVADVPTGGAGADVDVAAYGDFKVGFVIADRLGTTVRRLGEMFSLEGKVGFIVHRRVGGGVAEADALRILSVPRA